jgi:hypothetical protein
MRPSFFHVQLLPIWLFQIAFQQKQDVTLSGKSSSLKNLTG